MDIRESRGWMYNRLIPGRKEIADEFYIGVDEFVSFASKHTDSMSGLIRCACSKCKCQKYLPPDDVRVHLYQKGFKTDYWCWTSHGERNPNSRQTHSNHPTSTNSAQMDNAEDLNRFESMVYDAMGPEHGSNGYEQEEQPPNADAQKFYDLLNAAQKPLWPGCEDHTELSVAVRLMTIKAEGNLSQRSFNQTVSLMRETLPPGNLVPENYYQAKKIVSKLGLKARRIDCCTHGCMLFYEKEITECWHCGESRYVTKRTQSGKVRNNIPKKRMFYFPLIPRLKRLYASMSSAQHMRWHKENIRQDGVLCHPSDGEAWKHFDATYPDFKAEARNVRLGLCADGFTPWTQNNKPYSCWPVIVTPYNLPPEMCMTAPYMFLTLIIPGPNNPKGKIDVFLQPLIDELKLLWEQGVLTYDISKKENFIMRAALMWTINDFPAYGMLSGWSTAGKLACPYCMQLSKAFSLKMGGKVSWFDCHRQFLPMDHVYRRNKDAFIKNRTETSVPPPRLSGDEVWEQVSNFPKIIDAGQSCTCYGFGDYHNWTKQSIFWELPYWKTNKIRHNLDVMHIEKNFFDNVCYTVMDISLKTKDNLKARMDLKEYCRRKELELKQSPNGRMLKPKAKFALSMEQRRDVCKWVSGLRMPDGYASNLQKCVSIKEGKLFGMKSHDCHIFMERLLPIAFRALPDPIWKPLVELSKFFRDLCSTVLRVPDLLKMEENIVVTTCKLERIFPPGFFNSMEHLPIHLPYEARVGGPVQYRWMYPFERYMGKLKRMVKNKARVEGSICEAYLSQETSYFCTYYFESHVQTMRNTVGRNDYGRINESNQPQLSIFNHPGRTSGSCKSRYLNDRELAAAHLHVLLNCEEVQPYIALFEQHVRGINQRLNQHEVDHAIASDFPLWFRQFVQNKNNFVRSQFLHHLVWGPRRKVDTWPIYFVNGYRFHTEQWSVGKKTINCGVCVKGDEEGEEENYYYGIIKEIVELEYPGDPLKQLVLFNCEWFDAVINRGVKINKQYGIVEVRHTRRYHKYDPFIFAQNAIQVYYTPYPEKIRDKTDWWVVIRTKPRCTVDSRYTLEVAYQEATSIVDRITTDEPLGSLSDELGACDDVQDNQESEEEENNNDLQDDEDEMEFDFEKESEDDNDDVQQFELLDDEEEEDDDDDDE